MIKKFAKATALGLSAVMVLGLTACGGNGDKKTTEKATDKVTTEAATEAAETEAKTEAAKTEAAETEAKTEAKTEAAETEAAKTEAATEKGGEGETEAKTEAKAGDEAAVDLGTYPIVPEGEELTMTVFTMSMPNVTDLATNDFTKFLEEKTGIKIEFETGGRDDWKDKLNMTLSSGDYPDVILGVSPNVAKYGVKEGIFIQLDDLINEENCPNYLRVMGQYLDMQKQTDGHIYSLSGTNVCYHCSYGRKMWINQHYLDEMGVDMPTTTEEFYEVCKKFLEYKPDGIAIGGAAPGYGWFASFEDFLMGSFLLCPQKSIPLNVYDYTAVNKEGKVVCAAVDDRYKEFLKYVNSLYELGAIYDGNFTQTQEQFKTIVNQPDEPVLCFPEGTISDYIDSVTNNELYRHYVTMAPLKGPDGVQLSTNFKYDGVSGDSFVITDACENPELALRWVDFFFSPDGDLCSQYGAEEGTDWTREVGDAKGLGGDKALYKVLNGYSGEPQNHDWQDIGIRVAPADYRLGQAVDADVDPYAPEGLEKLLYDATKENYEPYGQDVQNSDLDILPELKFTDAESQDVSTIAVEIEKMIRESTVSFIMGTKDIDKEWDSYKDALDKAGLPKLLETYQTAYDRQVTK
ncbi:extracellular solute-binding protein [Murimonas intestini]|uniref:Aldouronate transport system substrate-binding protein n=1 Tax=Murimonas intestini TaxID=1337051 RepID=A0AB73SXN4_9FIRM|nr:extracellular solute-binding protein [Murimonas intestini]MCR1843406.1 extracellular solute-binding protein [Murimonas intestini]MCR1868740.1 extracellular solute-binding protein [Murimonas intestini]MCR1886273.1 extracellular solute-binding protein [Murimonas intestini]